MNRENLAGTAIAGYALHDMVGEGGTAVVYRAEHPEHGSVAVKVLREKLRNDRTAVARFLREASYGTRVSHPNVVRTLEVGEAKPGMHFLAIEWAAGEILDSYIRRNAPLSREETAEVIGQLAGAVHAAHAAGIVHRDLKPENVMYDPEHRLAKLLDFGIAAEQDLSPEERLTRAGFFVGTLMFVAPEALSGQLVTAAADQYSLATIAYNMLTGTLPYTARTQREMFQQLLSQPPAPLNTARKGCTYGPQVEAVIMKGLARNPADRYPSVLVFAEKLQEALLKEPEADNRGEGLIGKLKGMFGGK